MIWMAPLIALIGLLLMARSSRDSKRFRIGEIAYAAGTLAFLLVYPWSLHLPHLMRMIK